MIFEAYVVELLFLQNDICVCQSNGVDRQHHDTNKNLEEKKFLIRKCVWMSTHIYNFCYQISLSLFFYEMFLSLEALHAMNRHKIYKVNNCSKNI